MCGRYSSAQLSIPALAETFKANPAEGTDDQPNWNVTPTSKVLVVTPANEGSEDVRVLRRLRWGLVPNWAKDLKAGNRMINVRSETVADKPTFKRLLANRRCILPADGFYEWAELDPSPSDGGKKPRKQPFYITTRDGSPLALAGLWTTNTHADPSGPVETCTILTTDANEFMASIHHRMPVILSPEAWDTWLDPDVNDPEVLTALLRPAPNELLQMWPVDTAVNSPRSNGAELTRPLEGHEPRVWGS